MSFFRSSGVSYGAPAAHGITKYFGLAGTANQDIHVGLQYTEHKGTVSPDF